MIAFVLYSKYLMKHCCLDSLLCKGIYFPFPNFFFRFLRMPLLQHKVAESGTIELSYRKIYDIKDQSTLSPCNLYGKTIEFASIY
jgi:hypothetical protein